MAILYTTKNYIVNIHSFIHYEVSTTPLQGDYSTALSTSNYNNSYLDRRLPIKDKHLTRNVAIG